MDKNKFEKITFIANTELADFDNLPHDLTINIDSMGEMDEHVVRNYLIFIDEFSRKFYCKNPVGKYSMTCLEGQVYNEQVANIALSMGILRERVDIFDDQAVAKQVPAFLDAYRPGPNWNVTRDSAVRPWTYYHQALFQKTQ